MNRKILIVNFNFPPNSSIGGRRWSYMAEGLSKLNFEIHVITSDFFEINKGESPWSKCISGFEKNITYLPHRTPYHVLNKTPNFFINKIRYKISEKKAKIKKDANPYDRSIYFSQGAFDLALEKIKKLKIKNLILTGGPYDFLYRLSKLKVLFGNNLNLIVDYRDPWTEFYSDGKLKEPISIIERKQHNSINTIADCIYTPYNFVKKQNLKIWKNINIKILTHGFDSNVIKFRSDLFRDIHKWCYAGTLYPNLDKEINVLKNLLYETGSKLSIYTHSDYMKYPELSQKNIIINKLISQEKLIKITENFGVFIYFLNEEFKNRKSSKFYELIRLGVFIIYLGPKGEVYDFIEKYKIGISIEINDDNFKKLDYSIIKNSINKYYELFKPKPYLAEKFSFNHLCKEIINDLI